MTKIAIVPNAAGTGTFTIEAPNSNSNRTLVLPDAAGELLTDVSDIETQVKAATNATGSAPVYACRAWVNFDGNLAGTTAPRASGNVSSITREGTGQYLVNLTTAISDSNYATLVSAQDSFQTTGHGQSRESSRAFPVNTTSYRVTVYLTATNAFTDTTFISSAIFR